MPPKISRFDIHDELTAPPESAPILKGALSGSGKLNNFVGVLAGSPAALRGYARMRSELRRGTLPWRTSRRWSRWPARSRSRARRARSSRSARPPDTAVGGAALTTQTGPAPDNGILESTSADAASVCPYFHEAVELLGKRWTGA